MASTHRKLIPASEKLDTSQCQSCSIWCPYDCNPPPYYAPPPSPPTNSSHKILRLPLPLLIILSILVAVSFLLFCYTLYKSYKNWVDLMNRRRRRRPPEEPPQEETHDQFLDQDHGPLPDHPVWYIRTVGLQSSVISSIAICKYRRGDGLVEGTECSVCLNEFQEDETLRLMPKCNHAFHIPCIDTWLRSHTNCPLCRAGIVGNSPAELPEQSGGDPGAGEESQAVVDEGFEREREGGELVGIEEGERGEENWEKSVEAPEEDLVCQPERRSVSSDCVYASITSSYRGDIAGSSGKTNESIFDVVPDDGVDENLSMVRFGEGPISMRRSLSCSGKG